MRDAVASSSPQQGSIPYSTAGFDSDREDTDVMVRVGQAALLLGGAALVALAARQGRWKTIGAAALAGAPLIYRGATGHWPVPQSVVQKASDALASQPIEASILKVFGTETLDFVVDEALQILGGYGFVADYPLERQYRDSRRPGRPPGGRDDVPRCLHCPPAGR